MPDPDGAVTARSLANKAVTSRTLDTDLTVEGDFQAGRFLTEPFQFPADATHTYSSRVINRRIEFLTGDTGEVAAGHLGITVSGSSPTAANRQLFLVLRAPTVTTDPDVTTDTCELVLTAEALDDTVAPAIRALYAGASALAPRFRLHNGFRLQLEPPTTATGANAVLEVVSGAEYELRRSTSSLTYKPGWRYAEGLADRPLPRPIVWPDGDRERIGYGAEHVAETVVEASEHEQYDLRALVAILQAKIERLEDALGT